MAPLNQQFSFVPLAQQILSHASDLDALMSEHKIEQPSLRAGATTELWSPRSDEVNAIRNNILGLTSQLTKLLSGPHGYLHDMISTNWELGALYTILEFDILSKIPLQGAVPVSELAAQTTLPQNKLLSILRLVACEQILEEVHDQTFGHTAISEELVHDPDFKSFLGFELFETRIASTHLADSLTRLPNGYEDGMSAFKHATGQSMYEWHAAHPEKAARFGQAMRGVTKTLDPGNELFRAWFERNRESGSHLVIDTHAKNSSTATFLAESFLTLNILVQLPLPVQTGNGIASPEQRITFVHRNQAMPQDSTDEPVLAYLIRNVLWNTSDEGVVQILRGYLAVLEQHPNSVLLVNEMLSPAPGTFAPHVEIAYRRRDVTTMTMHNAKQRNENEWRQLFATASPNLQVNLSVAHTSHSFRGLWELRWRQQ